ncbi:hypothetical protein ACQEVF_56705 [Nonomuraea polychroma]|uniref:hypothetical protein n=1 Tax=Nonomuraea polychroma TaxID=46176 RepID=UPI003D92FC57
MRFFKHESAVTDETTGRVHSHVIASAALISRKDLQAVPKSAEWQAEAWQFYDEVSELRSGVGWLANALSRARLYVGVEDPDGSSAPAPAEHQQAQAVLDELFSGQQGQGEMLRRMAVHLDVPGESFLTGFDYEGQRRWLCLSGDEIDINRQSGACKVRLPESDQQVALTLGDGAPPSSACGVPTPSEASTPTLPSCRYVARCGSCRAYPRTWPPLSIRVWPGPASCSCRTRQRFQRRTRNRRGIRCTLIRSWIS